MDATRFALALVVLTAGCDKEPSKLDAIVEASSLPTAAPPQPPKSSTPTAPSIAVDDSSCTINGEPVLFSAADAQGRIAAVLTGKPLVEGQVVTFDAARDVKTPKVAAVVAALRKVKAKGAVVHTPMRDKNMGELTLLLQHSPLADCSAVGMVNKDGSIAVWPVGGGVAQKFVRGFAGPDLTLGPEALQKLAGGCDSATWLLAADENIPWGLTFDLALATRGAEGGAAMRPNQVLLVTEAPVAGRKVAQE
jgi:hypothetical protein